MKMTNEVKGLRQAEKKMNNAWYKPFKVLHKVKGFDFESPINVISGKGAFTLNGIKKQISDTNGKTFALITFEDRVYTMPNGEIKHQYEMNSVDIAENFSEFIPVSTYNNKLGSFNSKKDFEITRKNQYRYWNNVDLTWFVVYQDNKFLKFEAEKEIDYTERNTNKNIRENTAYRKSIYGETFYRYDKSGYYLESIHAEYKRRANKLRHEKAKQKADNTSNEHIAYAEKLLSDAKSLKADIISLMQNDEYKKLEKVFRVWNGYSDLMLKAEKHLDRLMNKEYSSVSDIESEENDIKSIYETIKSVINS